MVAPFHAAHPRGHGISSRMSSVVQRQWGLATGLGSPAKPPGPELPLFVPAMWLCVMMLLRAAYSKGDRWTLPLGWANAPCSLARSCRIGCSRMILPSAASCTDPATMETWMRQPVQARRRSLRANAFSGQHERPPRANHPIPTPAVGQTAHSRSPSRSVRSGRAPSGADRGGRWRDDVAGEHRVSGARRGSWASRPPIGDRRDHPPVNCNSRRTRSRGSDVRQCGASSEGRHARLADGRT